MTKKPIAPADKQAEMNLLAAQTERFDEYKRWISFRLGLIIIMTVFLIGLEGWRIYRVTQLVNSCVQIQKENTDVR